MAKYLLFTITRKPDVLRRIEAPDEVLQNTLVLDGGAVYARGGLQIDASMRNCRVVAQQNNPIALSVLGRMLSCHIEGQDVLIEETLPARSRPPVTWRSPTPRGLRDSSAMAVN